MRLTDRMYEPSDVKVLMEKIGGRADSWDDVLHYLDGPAKTETGLSSVEVQQLADDMRDLKQDDRRFTTDYREVWRELSDARHHDAGRYKGIAHANGNGRVDGAEPSDPSSRVMDVLRRVQSREYREMAGLRESTSRHGSRP